MDGLRTHTVRGTRTVWDHYIAPLIRGAKWISESGIDAHVRVYLAGDLGFLVPELSPFCEIHLMEADSICAQPGMLWRLLALEDHPGLLTVLDSELLDRHARVVTGRTADLATKPYQSWRQVRSESEGDSRFLMYRPMLGGYFGTRMNLPVRSLLLRFLSRSCGHALPTHTVHPARGELEILDTRWPDYGFDEWFLLSAIFPRLAAGGFGTYANFLTAHSPVLLPLDLAYVNARHPKSELFHYVLG